MKAGPRRLLLLGVVGCFAVAAALGVVAYVDDATGDRPSYSQIEPGLWMGGSVPEPPPGVHSVLNLCEIEDPYKVPQHRWDPIPDAAPAPNRDWLRKQVAFVEGERAAGRTVYVHCAAGVSRAGMVMTAYIMKREGWGRDRAIEYLRGKRPVVNPNPAFLELLLEWEKEMADGRSR